MSGAKGTSVGVELAEVVQVGGGGKVAAAVEVGGVGVVVAVAASLAVFQWIRVAFGGPVVDEKVPPPRGFPRSDARGG